MSFVMDVYDMIIMSTALSYWNLKKKCLHCIWNSYDQSDSENSSENSEQDSGYPLKCPLV